MNRSALDPEVSADVARRLTAKLLADQANQCQMSLVKVPDDTPDAFERYLDGDDLVVILVARADGARHVLDLMGSRGGYKDAEIVPVRDRKQG